MTDTQIAWLSEGLEVLLAEMAEPDQHKPFDVVIIGSGYGGAIAAARLAGTKKENGDLLRIAVLERGKEYLPGMFPASVSDLAGHVRATTPLQPNVVGNRDGLFDLHASGDINALVASGLGGGSLINAGVMERPHPDVFDERWPKKLQGGQALDNFYTRVKEELGAARGSLPNTILQHPQLKKNPLHKFRSLKKLGGDNFRVAAITVAMNDGPNHSRVHMSACKLCGDCATGCNFGAKDSLDVNLLVAAKRRDPNVRIFTEATVLSLAGADDAWTIEVIHTQPRLAKRAGKPAQITAAKVILAAGTFGSTEILLRSRALGLAVSGPLGEKFSGNGDMLAVGLGHTEQVNAVADEAIDYDERRIGPTITGVIDLRDSHNPPLIIEEMAVPGPLRRFFEEIFTTAGCLHDLGVADTSRHTLGNPEKDPLAVDPDSIKHSAVYAVMGDDGRAGTITQRSDFASDSDGSVTVSWQGLGHHPLFPAQISALESLAATSDSGGRILANPLWRPLPSGLDFLVGTAAPRGPLLTVHPLGGCVMGDDDTTGVVDDLGRVFFTTVTGAKKVYETLAVMDGAIIPSALGTNPALTIAAVAARAVEGLISAWRLQKPSVGPRPDIVKRPVYRVMPTPEPPLDTTMKFVERLRGEVELHTKEGTKPYQAEITLYFEDKLLRDLYACRDNQEGTAHTLKVATRTAPANMVSRLRLFDQAAWEKVREKGFSGRELEEELDAISLLTAPLTGKLTIMGRQPTRQSQREWAAFRAWLKNRGIRDGFQSLAALYDAEDYALQPRELTVLERAEADKSSKVSALRGLLSRAGEIRLFEYHLTLGTPSIDTLNLVKSGHNSIRGTKHISYRHRSNPLDQLSTATLSQFPGMAARSDPVLTLVPEFLARKGLPLFRVVQQKDSPQALVDMLSLAAYFLRLIVSIHILTFRMPDAATDRPAVRVPGNLPGLPDHKPFPIMVQEESPGGLKDVGEILLTRYPGNTPTSRPVMLIHGYSASGTTFAHPSLKLDLTRYLWHRGWDVWVLDMRSSCGAKTATENYTFEQLAATDIPIAVDHICKVTKKDTIDIVAHCMGAAMFSMAVLDPGSTVAGKRYHRERSLLPGRIRRAALSQVGPLVTLAPRNIFLAYLFSYLKYYLPLEGYEFSPPASNSLVGGVLDRILAATPYPAHEFDLENPMLSGKRTPWVRTRHRMDLLYGRTFSLANMSEATLNHIDDFFGPLSVETATQVVHFAKYQSITNHIGFNDYASRARLRQYWCFPTLSVHGSDNGLSDPSTLHRMETILKDAGCDYRCELPFKDFGHQDSLIGKNPLPIFEKIGDFLAEEGQPSCPVRLPENGPMLVQVPWAGPVIGSVQNGDLLPVSFGYNPALSQPLFVVVIPLTHGPGGFGLVFDAAHTLARCEVYPAPAFEDGWGKMLLPLQERARIHSLLLLLAYDESPQLDNALFGTADALFDEMSFKLLDWAAVLVDNAVPATLVAAVEDCIFDRRHNIETGIVKVPGSGQPDHLHIALGSCQYPPGIIDQEPGFHSYQRLATHLDGNGAHSQLDFVLLMGDQVYVDPTAGLADPKSLDERFLYPYHNWYRSREVRKVLRQLPSYMGLDDHEIADNWEPLPYPDPANEQALELGSRYYLNFQRGLHQPVGSSMSFQFEHNDFHFFVADTRTVRADRTAINVRGRSLLGSAQTRELEIWLAARAQDDPERPKFIVCPAMFAPRGRYALRGKKTASAIHGDGWEGYPASFMHFLQRIAAHKLQNLVLLSGDTHLSGIAAIALQSTTAGYQPACQPFWSVHASSLFAPYPFANSQREEFLERETFDVFDGTGTKMADCHVQTEFYPGDGFAFLEVKKIAAEWKVFVSFDRKAGVSGPIELQQKPPPFGCAPPAS